MEGLRSLVVYTHSAAHTRQVGALLAQYLQPGDILWLRGELGVGKTTLVQGIAQGLHVTEPVLSPTFTLVREHRGKYPLFHADAYRLQGAEEAEDVGIADYLRRQGVIAIEWAEHIAQALPPERLDLLLEFAGGDLRRITLTAYGERYIQRLPLLEEHLAATGYRDNGGYL